MNAPLLELATTNGIVLEYHDIWGNLHQPTEATLRAVLQAMGVAAHDDGAVQESLDGCRQAQWSRALPAAVVVREDQYPWLLELRLGTEPYDGELHWTLEEESGAIHAGRVELGQMEVLHRATVAGRTFVASGLRLALPLPCGYHRLRIEQGDQALADTRLCVVPRRGYWPPAMDGNGRVWGVAAQLYGVRSARNWGIGDFSDLATIVGQWGDCGAGVVGVNPLHASYPHNPAHASPYSPSSRLFKNWIYIDVEACPELQGCEEVAALIRSAAFQERLRALRDADLVDYAGVGELKRTALELLYAHFRARHLSVVDEHAARFRAFQAAGGLALRRHALFDALQEHMHGRDASIWGWPLWPADYQDPNATAVRDFCAAHLERVEFFEYLQWHADTQYGAAARRSLEMGLGVGIYEDLAVSIDRAGAEAWANKGIYAEGASVGAPPDDFALHGQDWGLPPMVPHRLQAAGYAPFIDTLRANMRHAGALRIDHVMGLMRLFWVPPGGKATEGVYVRYPFADLLGLLVLESRRNRCLLIGEDLGTVPDEVRHALGEAGVLSYRLLYFERRHDGGFKLPQDYPVQAIVAASTHDLPTLIGWWEGRDLALRTQLDLFPSPAVREAQIAGRAHDRARLLMALEAQAALPADVPRDPSSVPSITPALCAGVHAFLGATPSKLMIVQLEDATGVGDQSNLPGTTTEHPNWRRKLPLDLERCPDTERFTRLTRALHHLRPRAH